MFGKVILEPSSSQHCFVGFTHKIPYLRVYATVSRMLRNDLHAHLPVFMIQTGFDDLLLQHRILRILLKPSHNFHYVYPGQALLAARTLCGSLRDALMAPQHGWHMACAAVQISQLTTHQSVIYSTSTSDSQTQVRIRPAGASSFLWCSKLETSSPVYGMTGNHSVNLNEYFLPSCLS